MPWLRQYAFDQEEIDLLQDLVEFELREPYVTDNPKYAQIEKLEKLHAIYNQLEGKLPTRTPDAPKDPKEKKTKKPKGESER